MGLVAWPDAGELDRRIHIRKLTDVPNIAFGLTGTLDAGSWRWAKREPVRALAYRGAAQVGEEPTDVWWVRSGTDTRQEDITTEHVIEFKGRRYRVLSAQDVEGAGVFTLISTKDLGVVL